MTKKVRMKITKSGSNHNRPRKRTWDMPLTYKPFRERLKSLIIKGGDTVDKQ